MVFLGIEDKVMIEVVVPEDPESLMLGAGQVAGEYRTH